NAVITPVSGLNSSGNLLQANVYPNPSHSMSALDLYVPQNGSVQVDLLNNLGQKIKTIFSGTMTRGKHSLDLTDKINNVPAGVYLLRIQAANKVLPVKLLVQ
ncbi:MAG TPA: T9SS type A sorting domain-containing protein, partial [Chitinophagaceae bacterium]